VSGIVTRAVNQSTGAASLDYRDQGDKGLRVIAVGGNSLSRGLTLEGLTTSYFHRNSHAYDTLMQMGRWFGYRDGYEDLCRVWMTEMAQGNYSYIAQAIDELRVELKRMKRHGMTPKEFGLKVRDHPGALVITARNKMRRANELIWEVSLAGQLLETSRLHSLPSPVRENNESVARWLEALTREFGDPVASAWGVRGWDQVPKERIAELLRRFQAHPLNHDFQGDALADYLESTDEEAVRWWHVRVPSGSGGELSLPNGSWTLKPRVRHVVNHTGTRSILVSGSSARVGSPDDEREGLDKTVVDELKARYAGRTVPGDEYRSRRQHPVLIINVLRDPT
jgi:hypothetical protein